MNESDSASHSVTSISLPDQVITFKHKHGLDLVAAKGSIVLDWVHAAFKSSARLTGALARLDALPRTGASPKVRGHLWLWRALKDVLAQDSASAATRKIFEFLSGPNGGHWLAIVAEEGPAKPASPSGVQYPAFELKPEWQTELMTWLVINDEASRSRGVLPRAQALASARDANDAELALTQRLYAELSFLEPVRQHFGEVIFFSSETLELVQEYKDLARDRWKPEGLQDATRAHNILARYISYLNDLGGAGGSFDIERVRTETPDYPFHTY